MRIKTNLKGYTTRCIAQTNMSRMSLSTGEIISVQK